MRGPARRLNVLIVTSNTLFLENIKLMLPYDCKIVHAPQTERVIETKIEDSQPHLIVIDTATLAKGRMEAGQRIARLVRHFPNRPIIVCMPHLTDALAKEGDAAGVLQLAERFAHDGANSPAGARRFERTLRLLAPLAQDPAISPVKVSTIPLTVLSGRESEVLTLVANGHPMKEIAHRLDVSYRTVAYHKYKLMKRLGIRTHAALVSYAVRRGDAPVGHRGSFSPGARLARFAAGQSK